MSYEIEGATLGSHINAMVVELNSHFIEVTIQNSKILGCKQEPILSEEREKREFHKLGIVPKKAGPINSGKFYTLSQLISQAGLNQYATMNSSNDILVHNFPSGESDFNASKLRDMQNLDWSEDSVLQGLNYEKGFLDPQTGLEISPDPLKALDFYTNAVELDPLNKQAF